MSYKPQGVLRTASFGAIPLGLALPFRVHHISTTWRDSEMTAKNNHPELIEKLAEGISNLTTSAEWQRYLDCQSRFHRYSFGNVLLIAAQCHEATQVAGFNAWRKCVFRRSCTVVPELLNTGGDAVLVSAGP